MFSRIIVVIPVPVHMLSLVLTARGELQVVILNPRAHMVFPAPRARREMMARGSIVSIIEKSPSMVWLIQLGPVLAPKALQGLQAQAKRAVVAHRRR